VFASSLAHAILGEIASPALIAACISNHSDALGIAVRVFTCIQDSSSADRARALLVESKVDLLQLMPADQHTYALLGARLDQVGLSAIVPVLAAEQYLTGAFSSKRDLGVVAQWIRENIAEPVRSSAEFLSIAMRCILRAVCFASSTCDLAYSERCAERTAFAAHCALVGQCIGADLESHEAMVFELQDYFNSVGCKSEVLVRLFTHLQREEWFEDAAIDAAIESWQRTAKSAQGSPTALKALTEATAWQASALV